MPRYFIEVAYKGSNYSGSQKQQNANSVQAEVEKALGIFFKVPFSLTGASRTDAGVHALQNYYHFDSDDLLENLPPRNQFDLKKSVYSLNAILPADITVKNVLRVSDIAHCRFDAKEREYKYFIYWKKNPFLMDTAYFFPYKLQLARLQAGAIIIKAHTDFTSFAKRSVDTGTFFCTINKSSWTEEDNVLVYTISGNRFLRGMVRGLVGTMLKLGREILTPDEFENILLARNSTLADFSAPAHGLFLQSIKYDNLT